MSKRREQLVLDIEEMASIMANTAKKMKSFHGSLCDDHHIELMGASKIARNWAKEIKAKNDNA